MNAVAKVDEQKTLPGIPEAPAAPMTMMDVLNRAIFDPTVDAEKVERIGALAMSFQAAEAKQAYNRDMLVVKLELPIIDRKGRIQVREKDAQGKRNGDLTQDTPYARWEDIDAAITPVLNRHGFTLTHRTGFLPDGKVTVTAVVTHRDGHSEESTMAMPLDTSGSKNNVQAVGSSISYGKRYTASALLNLRTKGEDDDGKYAGEPGRITDDQLEKITDLITRVDADVPAFCEFMGVNSVPDILSRDYEKAIRALNLKATKAAQKKGQA